MKNFLKLMMTAAVAAVITTGCAKKPKINLIHLRDNAPSTGLVPNDDANSFVEGGFLTPSQPAGFENAGNTGNGGWEDMNKPVSDAADANAFLVNPSNWDAKVYFDYNRSEIKASERPVLDNLAQHLNKNTELGLIIEGHCDERGSDEYNRSLSERRALAIRDYLNLLGVASNRMQTISYGEDKPAVPNAKTDKEHGLNRRGQFLVGNKK